MTSTQIRPIEHYVERIQRHLLRKYPDLQMRVVKLSDDEVYIYFHLDDPEANWFPVIHRASRIAVDVLVDYDYKIRVQPE